MIFILDQNHAFLKGFIICHIVLVLNFLNGKGDFCPGIYCFECGLFTHLCKALQKLSAVFGAVIVLNTSLSRGIRITSIPTPEVSLKSTFPQTVPRSLLCPLCDQSMTAVLYMTPQSCNHFSFAVLHPKLLV